MLLILLALASQPTIKLPAEIIGRPGEFVAIRAETEGKIVRYVAIDSGLNVFPAALLADSRATVVTSIEPGRYRLLAYTATDAGPSEPVVVVVVIGPGTPPKPPMPIEPDDALTAAIGAIWGAIHEPGQNDNRVKLAALYRRVAGFCADDKLKTVGDLFTAAGIEAGRTLPVEALAALRDRAAVEIRTVAPTDPAAGLTNTIRADIAKIYNKIANILENLK